MPKLFTPITYNEGDLVAYKFVGTTQKTGCFCKIAPCGTVEFRETRCQAAFAGGAVATLAGAHNTGGTLITRDQVVTRTWFPVFKDNPDIEATYATDATITAGDRVIGFYGREFEIHYSYTGLTNASFLKLTAGTGLVVGTSSKLVQYISAARGGPATIAIAISTMNNILRAQLINR